MSGLENKIIISTRPLSEDDSIKELLISKGANVLDFPMIEIVENVLDNTLKSLFANIDKFQWIVFTSMNGVRCFFRLLNAAEKKPEDLSAIKIAVIGIKTASEVRKYNIEPAFISTGNDSFDLYQELKPHIVATDSLLLPLAEIANDKLEKGLAEIAHPVRINVYKTQKPAEFDGSICERIRNNAYDLILFTSPSGFQNFKELMQKNAISMDIKSACIGATTEKKLIANKLQPMLVSSRSDAPNFVNEIEKYLTRA